MDWQCASGTTTAPPNSYIFHDMYGHRFTFLTDGKYRYGLPEVAIFTLTDSVGGAYSSLSYVLHTYKYSRNPHKAHLTTETPALCDHFWPSPELFLLYSCLSNTRYGDHPLLRPPRLVTTCSQSRTGSLNSVLRPPWPVTPILLPRCDLSIKVRPLYHMSTDSEHVL